MLRVPLSPLAIALLLLPAFAQERRALLGKVLDHEGKPLARATVTLLRVEAAALGPAAADSVTATADEHGSFQAKVLLGALYDGWAIGPETEGRHARSPVQCELVAGGTYELRCQAPTGPARVQLQGGDAWQANGPLRAEVCIYPRALFPLSRAGVVLPLTLDQDGSAPLPPMPACEHGLLVRRADGELLAWIDFTAGTHETVSLRPPVEVPFLALDEKGQPVAGVTIRRRVHQVVLGAPLELFGTSQRALWGVVGMTGNDGRLVARLPLPADPFAESGRPEVVLCASKDGSADSHSGVMGGYFRDGLLLAAEERPTRFEFVMHPSEPAQGRLRSGDRPLASVPVRVTAISKVYRDGGWTHLPRSFEVSTDQDGRYTVPQLPKDAYDLEVQAAVPLPVPADGKRGLVRPALAPLLQVAAGRVLQLPDLDLKQCTELPLRILDPRSGPARGAFGEAFALPDQDNLIPGALHPTFAVDPAGRVDLLLAPGRWLLCAMSDEGCGMLLVDPGAPPLPTTLNLKPYFTRRLHVIDDTGKDVADAMVRPGQRRSGNGGGEQRLRHLLEQAVDERLLATARSDAHGMLTLRLCAAGDDEDLGSVRITADNGRSATLALEPGDDVVEVRIE